MTTEVRPPASPLRAIASCFLPFAAGYFLSYLYRTVNAVIGPNLVAEFGLDAAALGLLTSAYFLGFATLQLPMGAALDRIGPRRTEAGLLLVAAAGAVVFATAADVTGLTIGRLLIGIGVSMCLMAAFKANAQFWPPERLALANGALMAFGGLGSTMATLPVEWLLQVMTWRWIFAVVAAVTILIAAWIYLAVPEPARPGRAAGTADTGLVQAIMRAGPFWWLAPSLVTGQGTYLAYMSLWAGPWLRDVAGYDRAAAAGLLATITISFMIGALLQGVIADRAQRRGVRLIDVLAGYAGCFVLAQFAIIVCPASWGVVLWPLFALLGAGSTLGYAILQRHFPHSLAGRVNSCMNLLIFVMAFIVQWGVGVVVDAVGPFHPASGHALALAALAVLQAAGLAWMIRHRRAT